LGTVENFISIATKINAAPKIKYGILILVISAFDATAVTEPNIAKLTKSGPIVVPKLFYTSCHTEPSVNPTLGSPIMIASGVGSSFVAEKIPVQQ
jgi:hypothetical protein